ncbi:MAG: UbiX family flavin prenyltransferase [Oscillospiraceae bacterium]|jgi:4-hydroxy-3-polyprenylbenzoate decarboxylase|nr:UbiX family flavin prenyltransferase [Oscillospiraceae bacterium]
MEKKRIIVGISGASGIQLGVAVLEVLRDRPDWETHLVMTHGAEVTLGYEMDKTPDAVKAIADVVHPVDDLTASISSGTFKTEGMIIAPCSMKTAAGIANGYSENLLLRAADVVIKEHRRLLLMPRESPLSSIHLKNLLALSEWGAFILPPMPAFYQKPTDINDIIKHVIGRALSYFGIETDLFHPWG